MNRSADCVALSNRAHAETGVSLGSGGLYYGWVILPVSMAALIATSPGQTSGVSIFNEAIRTSLGLTHSQLAGAYMLGTLLAALPLAFVGAWMDRQGARRTMITVIALFGLACMLTSQAVGWLSLLLTFFLLRFLGPGALSFLSSNTLAFWFHRRLGTAEGIRQLGYALTLIVIPLIYLWLLNNFGWRGSYFILGLVIWGVMLPLIIGFLRDRPEDVGQTIDGIRPGGTGSASAALAISNDWSFTMGEALCSRAGWIVTCGTALYSLTHTAVFFCIVPICHEQGFSETDAARLLSAFAVSLAIMHLVGGWVADRLPANLLLAIGVGGLAFSMVALLGMRAGSSPRIAGVMFGVFQGLFFATSNPLWPRYFGRLHIGRIRGTMATVNVATSSLGPLLAGLSRDLLGSFYPALVAFALAPIPFALLSLLATPPTRPQRAADCQVADALPIHGIPVQDSRSCVSVG